MLLAGLFKNRILLIFLFVLFGCSTCFAGKSEKPKESTVQLKIYVTEYLVDILGTDCTDNNNFGEWIEDEFYRYGCISREHENYLIIKRDIVSGFVTSVYIQYGEVYHTFYAHKESIDELQWLIYNFCEVHDFDLNGGGFGGIGLRQYFDIIRHQCPEDLDLDDWYGKDEGSSNPYLKSFQGWNNIETEYYRDDKTNKIVILDKAYIEKMKK